MKVFRPGKDSYTLVTKDEKKYKLMKNQVFEQFNPAILDLGDINQPSIATSAICTVYDLGGFTNFCKQIDPQLSVPLYLSGFLDWIFGAIRAKAVYERFEEGISLYHALPFFTKFLGDGLLILCDTSDMSTIAQHNFIANQFKICHLYISEFLPAMKKKVCDPPDALRCGITKGTIYSVGNGNDFVGPCINLAARLQKLPGARFAFARRGFDPESIWEKAWLDQWILKKVAIRGMENEELIYLRKDNFSKMEKKDQDLYHDP
jgi:class 3 adenylate cyclase